MSDDTARRLDDLEKRMQQLETARLVPTVRANPADRFPTLRGDGERPGAPLGVRVSEQSAHLGLAMNARLEGGEADDGA